MADVRVALSSGSHRSLHRVSPARFRAARLPAPWAHRHPDWEPGSATMERLEAVDVGSLTDAQRIDYVAAWDRCVRFVEARRARAMAAAAGIAPSDPAKDDAVLTLAGELTLSPTSSAHQVELAREMATVFPDTLAAVENGEIPMACARTMSRETVGLTAEQRAEVERAVLSRARRRTPYQHTAAVRREVKKIAPRPKPEDPCSPEQERRADVRDAGPWTSGLWMQGPTSRWR